MNKIKDILEGTYKYPSLRRRKIPLFMGNPGLGKTHIIEEFAKEKGVHLELFLTSSKSPLEIDGIGIPNLDRTMAVHVEFENLLKLKDGDMLFLDELPNGAMTLNSILTFVESRITAAGRKLPDITIIGAGNWQGIAPLTPQIKRRFEWINVSFDATMWKNYMLKTYNMPYNISSKLCDLIKQEDFSGYNFDTPADLDKATDTIIHGVHSEYKHILPILNGLITFNGNYVENLLKNKNIEPTNERVNSILKAGVQLSPNRVLVENETIEWLTLKKYEYGIIS